MKSIRDAVTNPDALADPEVSRRLRLAFRKLNRSMVFMWRLGLGPTFEWAPAVTGRVLVVLHTGRRSGTAYRTPLNFGVVGDAVYCLAGFGEVSDWYRNILAGGGEVEVWMPTGRWMCGVEEVSDHPQRRDLLRAVLRGSGVVAYAFGIPPTLPDERLDELSADYRLVRFTRHSPATGADRPGDLRWVWAVLAGLWFARLIRRRRSGDN
jgi:deazaflavin-dependent oxidoreductase (nitroreductase family)